MKKITALILLSVLLLASCGNSSLTVSESSTTASESSTVSTFSESTADVYTEDVDLTAIGGDSTDWDYAYRYYDIPSELIQYVGNDDFQQWAAKDYKAVNIQTVIERYHLTYDDLISVLSPSETPDPDGLCLTVSDVETLFSGDQAKINKTFASEYAAVSESGSIYTVFWLAAHTAEDYKAAGLSESAVETALSNCAELDIPAVNEYVAEAEAMING